MARADLARIDLVVVEIFFAQHPLLVTDQPIRSDARRIELDLNLHVLRDRDQRAAHLLHENFARLIERIEIGVVAVSFVGQLLHRRVLQIVVADTEHAQKHAALRFLFDQPNQIALIRSTPTLKSPSVARMTRFTPPLMKFSAAVL